MTEDRKGFAVLDEGRMNKSVAFTRQERKRYGLEGLLPYAVFSQDTQVQRVIDGLRRLPTNIEKYILLSTLQNRNENLYYRVVTQYVEEVLPLIYTPTVGEACNAFSHIFRGAKGFYITPDDSGQIRRILDNWPEKDIRAIVVTDGERILGLGDLGANGMGIPIGKLALYTACAGIPPQNCLPVMIDVGTNNQNFLQDFLYMGYPKERLTGEKYFDLIDEFVMAVQDKYPDALIQFEDFLTPNAYALLKKYKDNVLCFNDDIQGTAAVALAGVYASTRITGNKFEDLRIMFLGAGSAATGIADLMVSAFEEAGLSRKDAHSRLWFVDQYGLVVSSRDDLMEHNLPYAHDFQHLDFVEAVEAIKPHVIIGATGAPGTFTKEVVECMTRINRRPVIFALSNPTAKAECTAEQAYAWSQGKAIFASGSPFGHVEYGDKTYQPKQANNVYVFPGIGLGSIIAGARVIPDELFLIAASTLSKMVSDQDIQSGALFPRLKEIRKLSLAIAIDVAEKAYELGVAQNERPEDLEQHISEYMYNPSG